VRRQHKERNIILIFHAASVQKATLSSPTQPRSELSIIMNRNGSVDTLLEWMRWYDVVLVRWSWSMLVSDDDANDMVDDNDDISSRDVLPSTSIRSKSKQRPGHIYASPEHAAS